MTAWLVQEGSGGRWFTVRRFELERDALDYAARLGLKQRMTKQKIRIMRKIRIIEI